MIAKEEILAQVQATLMEMFDFSPSMVTPGARLVDDLDFDSIDALNLVIKLEAVCGKKIKPEQLKEIRSVQDIVDAVEALVNGG